VKIRILLGRKKRRMKNIINSLLCLWKMSEMSVINDRNVDGSNKHLIKYRARLFYIGHLTITISIFTSYSAANIRALFPFWRNGSIHSLSSEQTISRRKVVVRHRENFRGFLMKVGVVKGDACDRPFDSSFSLDLQSRLFSRYDDVTRFLAVTTVHFASLRSSRLFHRIMKTAIALLCSEIPWLPNDIARRSGMVNVRKMIRNFLSQTKCWNSVSNLSS